MSLTIEEKTNTQKKELSPVIQSVIQMGILLVLSFIGMFIMILVLFILIKNMPGSPYMFMLGENPTQSQIAVYNAYIENYGLDKPVISQFFIFYWKIISGNWGKCCSRRGTPVTEMIIEVYPKSLEINFLSFGFSLLLGVIFGVLAYKFKDKWFGLIPQAIKRLNWAILILGLGMLLQYTFGYTLGVFPSTNYFDPELSSVPTITHFRLLDCLLTGDFIAFWDTILHLIMPVYCLSFIMFSFITDLTYSIIDFYKTPKEVHLLSGKIAFYLSIIFTSNLLIEIVFSINGIFRVILNAINCIDINIIIGAFYCISLTFLIIIFSINFLLHLIRIIMELVKNSKTDNIIPAINTNSESFLSESSFNSPETVSEPNSVNFSLVLDENEENDVNKKPIGKEIFMGLRRKIFNPLTIIGIIFISFILILAIFAAKLSPYDFTLVQGIDMSVEAYSAPSSEHILGVTKFGRDVYSRCLYGIRTAVKVGFISTLIGMPLGVFMGIISAYFGKWAKYVIDIINGLILMFPGILFAIFIISILGNELSNFYWILGLVILPITTLFSQQAISYEMKKGDIKPLNFSKQNGRKILLRLPNIILSILGVGCLVMGLAILTFEGLNYMGLGDPMIASLGLDILFGVTRLTTAPWASFSAAFCSYITILGFIMLGIGLKEE